ncbi:MAG: hypothetical protein ACK5NN_15855 [Sphingomonadaceae bacterium]
MIEKFTSPQGRRPGMGEFAFQPVAGAFQPTLESMASTEKLMGMDPEGLYLWGTLRDEEGNMYCPMRRIPYDLPGAKKDTRRYFFLQHNVGHDHFIMDKVGRHSAPNDGHFFGREGDRIVWRSAADARGNPFYVEWTPESCRWVEEGVMDVRGTLIRPGLQWYIPSRSSAMAYIACIFLLEGEIMGRKVRGLIGFDVIYMYEGGEVYITRDPLVQEELELMWYTWATVYKDGTLDAGHFLIGNDLMGFGILTNEKEQVRLTYDVDCEVTYGADGYWHTGIRANVFGEEYEFLPDPRGRMPDLGPIPNPQLDGRWRKVGDTREPDVWFAWGESASAHGTVPRQRLPGIGQRIATPLERFSRDQK